MSTENLEEITPDDSIVPVFLSEEPLAPYEDMEPSGPPPSPEQSAAVEELISKGFSENTARLMVGLPAL